MGFWKSYEKKTPLQERILEFRRAGIYRVERGGGVIIINLNIDVL